MLLLLIIVGTTLSISFLCSVLEATLLSINVTELSHRKEKGEKAAARLLELKEKRLDDAIAAILTCNTIAHTIGAALSGWRAAQVFGGGLGVAIFSGVLTVLILVLTEIIPKTLGTAHASRLVGSVGLVLHWLIKPPMQWILILTRALTRFVARDETKLTTRGEVRAMIKIAERDGALHPEETQVIFNWLQFKQIHVTDVMTPRTVVVMLEDSETVASAIENPQNEAFSRLPIYSETRDNVLGYVLMRELLRAATVPGGGERKVVELMRNVIFMPETLSLGEALRQFTKGSEHLAVVVDEHGGVSGIVTMEDILETGLGVEIVDEYDRVADLRVLASELRDRRLLQLQGSKLRRSDGEEAAG